MTDRAEIEAVIEAVLFVASEPLPRAKILEVFGERDRAKADEALAAVGLMTGDLCEEVIPPITVILGQCELMRAGGEAESPRMRAIEAQARRIARAVEHHRGFAPKVSPTPLDARALAREAVLELEPVATKAGVMLHPLFDDVPSVAGNPLLLKRALRQQHKKLQELESLRADFRRRRYDQSGYSFSDGNLIAAMLGNFLDGVLDRDSLWRVLEQQQRYRPKRTNPTFGSGGFGRGSVWGGRRGGLGGRLGGGLGRGGGGGFRTGGGF